MIGYQKMIVIILVYGLPLIVENQSSCVDYRKLIVKCVSERKNVDVTIFFIILHQVSINHLRHVLAA